MEPEPFFYKLKTNFILNLPQNQPAELTLTVSQKVHAGLFAKPSTLIGNENAGGTPILDKCITATHDPTVQIICNTPRSSNVEGARNAERNSGGNTTDCVGWHGFTDEEHGISWGGGILSC